MLILLLFMPLLLCDINILHVHASTEFGVLQLKLLYLASQLDMYN